MTSALRPLTVCLLLATGLPLTGCGLGFGTDLPSSHEGDSGSPPGLTGDPSDGLTGDLSGDGDGDGDTSSGCGGSMGGAGGVAPALAGAPSSGGSACSAVH